MKRTRIAISTQTPLLKFSLGPRGAPPAMQQEPLDTRQLRRSKTVQLTPGGVCRMVLPELKDWKQAGGLRAADWFSLQPSGPREIEFRDLPLTVHHLSLPRPALQAYARTKEILWNSIHGFPADRFTADDFRFYSRYNWFTADHILETSPDADIAYVHDFQLLQVGALIGPAAPVAFRWHVPFQADLMPSYTRHWLLRAMEDFDVVIVSTRRDHEEITNSGFHGRARQVYPHIDPSDWPRVTSRQQAAAEEALGLGPDDPLILVVARMDPMKRQDLAIQALARIRNKHPKAKLVLVGNGSFSSSTRTGLGLDKGTKWARRLQRLARRLRLGNRVIFAHWLSDALLPAVYARATIVVLPSDLEGFGLTILEGWRYARPCIASTGAGVSEIIHDGVDGFTFPAGSAARLAARLDDLLRRRGHADALGQAGNDALPPFSVGRAAPRLRAILEDTIRRFGGR